MWGSGGIAPPFLTSAQDGGEWSDSLHGLFTPPVSIGQEAAWAPEPVWTLEKRKISFTCQELNPGRRHTDCCH
jgi:hypothetical protein